MFKIQASTTKHNLIYNTLSMQRFAAENDEGRVERVVIVADSEHTSARIGERAGSDGACKAPTILGSPSRCGPQST